ncbi:MAG: hypothetical protein ACPLQO_04030 [Desulfotomaculales bacterium]
MVNQPVEKLEGVPHENVVLAINNENQLNRRTGSFLEFALANSGYPDD